ncbi:CBS domain-containing protein [Salinilacihabitans rarus]|uniref:CBS domain-containing protein n=1 Tax=Salinilacihabitans rarus TaxID=2961596 RepID=UPI0020C877C9|nr:CBS domain-containing protein [Salinilacihabitans rarus]
MPVQNLARSDVVTASIDASIRDLATTMRDERVGSVVVTEAGAPVGIVTDRDLTVRVLATDADPAALDAADVMSPDLHAIGPDDGFYQATEMMRRYGVRRLPVVDDDRNLRGIITADDLNELLADEHQEMAGVVRAQRPPY